MPLLPKTDAILIREVWNENLEEEFSLIREIVDDYPYVAMDTEFPGIVLRPVGNFKNSYDYHYQTLKDNVDMLKLIQLGLTFSDEQGNLPTCGTDKYCIWQFNFREFNVNEDVFANDSIELLRQSGIDFKKNNEKGIDAQRFGELLMSSGIVLNDSVHWVTFHSGYDFGYLLKLLTCHNLPDTQVGFFNLINVYFPTVYDIKHLMKFCNSLHGGLNKLAELLEVERVGICHQAGSDSLLTSCTFRKLKENFFSGSMEKYAGVLYGLGVENGQREYGVLRNKAWEDMEGGEDGKSWNEIEILFEHQDKENVRHFKVLKIKVTFRLYRKDKGSNFIDEAPVAVEAAAAPALGEPMDIMTALQLVLRKSLAHGGLIRGLHEAAKVIEKHAAQLCVLAEDCDQPDYVKLVKALCADHNVNMLTVPSAKTLGEWAGLCKIDSEGKARKVVGCSCVVVKDFGEDHEALHVVQQHVKA
ncbi:hypothetical protein FEM48_Zijuj01G0313500 [Ziziphus jujuba var. spinosa]|uniref:40S ribosomal protein S12 n=1 Tax=Ziziphus jujuba var. spinosa TaxID=714518 RepID=A0A978W686_ZIZJJ|nr:hypothetical protein FEM48_Zijuj01G0313500 [Ziziphus jujuba var. spinosa]